jgi:diguanylate cyclase (GGDEF)-like protein
MPHRRRAVSRLRDNSRTERTGNSALSIVARPSWWSDARSSITSFLGADQGFNSLRAVRQAAALFLAAGLIGFVSDLLLGGITGNSALSFALDAANLVIGAICWFFLRNWAVGYRSLVLVGVALTDVALNNLLGEITGGTLGIWFVVVFVWVGAWYPPRISLFVAPWAVLAYVLPYRFANPPGGGTATSVLFVMPTAVLVGLTISANAKSARRAESEQRVAFAALAKANITDDLTSLGNRRFGNELIDSVQPGDVIVLLDLDQFKEVNDHYGHQIGDQVLQELGEFLGTTIAESGEVARMGGEEFLLLYRHSTDTEGALRATMVVDQWRARQPLSTLSAGIALHRDGQSPSTTYRLADEALYLAKSRGRAQVAIERRSSIRLPSVIENS